MQPLTNLDNPVISLEEDGGAIPPLSVAAEIVSSHSPSLTPIITSPPTESNFEFIPESTGLILGLDPPKISKIRKGYTTPEIQAYRKWCSDLKKLQKIRICSKPKFIADVNLVKKKDSSYRITHNFGPLRSITSTLTSTMPKITDIIHKIAQFQFVAKLDLPWERSIALSYFTGI
eukprot:GHVP01011912.1.p1 GENE.GHVP01011912.1~~GHVP01011912.1.p1  ORF type:complete len:175 (-),score=16.62 GHVP01011912.1:611-1135(-)